MKLTSLLLPIPFSPLKLTLMSVTRQLKVMKKTVKCQLIPKSAFFYYKELMTFAISQQNISMIDSLVNVGNHLYSSKIANAKQTKIDDFFNKKWILYICIGVHIMNFFTFRIMIIYVHVILPTKLYCSINRHITINCIKFLSDTLCFLCNYIEIASTCVLRPPVYNDFIFLAERKSL